MFNKYRDTEKDILDQDLSKLGTAGLSARQKGQQMGMAQQQAAQQGAVQQGLMNQQAMAAGPQMQGAYAQQSQNLASGAGAAGATAGFQANQLSAQIAQQRDAQIKADLTRQAEESQERWDKTVDTGMEVFGANQETKQEQAKATAAVAAAAAAGVSDIRIKEDIVHTGESPSGIPMYEFNYIGDSKRYRGTMAQDLLDTHPQAVTIGSNGYYAVYYDQIDVPFELITE